MYELIIDKQASKQIAKMDKPTWTRMMNSLVELQENPYIASNIRKLQGLDGYYRKRVENYRIIYSINKS